MKLKPYPQYKDSGIEWLGEVPAYWCIKRLKYLSSCNSDTLPESTDPDKDIRYVDISSVVYPQGIQNIEEMVFSDAPSRARRLVKNGDTIVSTVRTYLKAIAPIEGEDDSLVVSTGFAVIRPRYLVPKYLSRFLMSHYCVEAIASISVGVSYPAVNAGDIGNIFSPEPPIEEQQTIAAFLDRETSRIDALIQKKERLIELLKEKRIALITQAVTKGFDPNVPMKDSGIEWLGEVPEHWEVKKMKHIGNALIGLTYSPDDVVFDEGVLVLRSSNIQDGKLVTGTDDVYVTTTIPPKIVIKQFDILICSRNGSRSLIGKSAIIDSQDLNATFGVFMSVFRSSINDYVIWVLQSNMFSSLCSGYVTSTINQLTQSDLSNLTIPLPPREEQSSISRFLSVKTSEMDDLLKTTIKSISLLREYRSSLINAAVTGKIDLRDAL